VARHFLSFFPSAGFAPGAAEAAGAADAAAGSADADPAAAGSADADGAGASADAALAGAVAAESAGFALSAAAAGAADAVDDEAAPPVEGFSSQATAKIVSAETARTVRERVMVCAPWRGGPARIAEALEAGPAQSSHARALCEMASDASRTTKTIDDIADTWATIVDAFVTARASRRIR
jgi:hypothetical protein